MQNKFLKYFYYGLFFVLLCNCSNQPEYKSDYNESDLLNSIEVDSFECFNVDSRYINAHLLSIQRLDSLGNRELFPPVIIREKTVKWLNEWIVMDSLGNYEDLKSRGITKGKMEYIYSLMNEYSIKSIHWLPESNTLLLDIDTIQYLHITDSNYIKERTLNLKKIDEYENWWKWK